MLSAVIGMIFISLVFGGLFIAGSKYIFDNKIASIIFTIVTIVSIIFWVVIGKCYYDTPRRITVSNTSGEVVSMYEHTHILDFDKNEVIFRDANGTIQRINYQTGMIQYEREE